MAVTFTAESSNDEAVATVHVDSAILRSNSSITPVAFPSEVFTFAIDRQTGHVTPRAPSLIPQCTEAATVLPIYGIEVLPTIPAGISDTWIDTSTVQTCRGTVSITLIRIAAYVIGKPVTRDPVQVFRTTQVTVNGSGTQWSQKVAISGQGTATDTLLFSSSSSPHRLEQVNGTSVLELTFRSPFRVQQFSQTVIARISKHSP